MVVPLEKLKIIPKLCLHWSLEWKDQFDALYASKDTKVYTFLKSHKDEAPVSWVISLFESVAGLSTLKCVILQLLGSCFYPWW